MAIIGFNPDEIIEYIPKCERAFVAKDPDKVCSFGISHIPHTQVLTYSQLISKKSNKQTPDVVGQVLADSQKSQFINHIKWVKNYVVDGKELKTAAEVYEVADSDLIHELITAMETRSVLSEGQKKTLLLQSK